MRYIIILLFFGCISGQIKQGERVFITKDLSNIIRVVPEDDFINNYMCIGVEVIEFDKNQRAVYFNDYSEEINKLWKAYAKLKSKSEKKYNAVIIKGGQFWNDPGYIKTFKIAYEDDYVLKENLLTNKYYKIEYSKGDTLISVVPRLIK